MRKVSKKILFVLLIGALIIPMFVGCDDEPAVDLVAEAKKSFLSYVATTVNAKNVATVAISGTDITVTFKDGATAASITTAADELFVTLKGKAQAGSKIKLNSKEYDVGTVTVAELKADLLDLKSGNTAIAPYEVKVTHSSQSFTVKGNITFKDIPDSSD